jgi:uncharacterized protein YwgA
VTAYDFVHLVIYASGGEVTGRTKLQKVVYFAGVLTGRAGDLGYRAHYYGPYSPDVAEAVEELRSLKFLEQRAVANGVVDDQGFEKTRYDYLLTHEGKQVAEEKAAQWADDWQEITNAVRRLKQANVQDYVRLAIAAKTDLLSRQNGQLLSAEALKKKTAEYGWKAFTDEQYTDAIRFLQTVVGTPSQSRPATT